MIDFLYGAIAGIIFSVLITAMLLVLVYLHSEDYEFEAEIPLGLFGDEMAAQNQLMLYCNNNIPLLNAQDLISEKIVNKCVIERKEWAEGFTIVPL